MPVFGSAGEGPGDFSGVSRPPGEGPELRTRKHKEKTKAKQRVPKAWKEWRQPI